MTASMAMNVDDVRFVKELYPRLRQDDAAIERYRDAIDQLPPIMVARDGVLVDGYHRWQAHCREGRQQIAAENLGNLSDSEIFTESIRRNASHGHQLSQADKRNLAGKLWHQLAHLGDDTEPHSDPEKAAKGKMQPAPGSRTHEIMAMLSVSERSIQSWTKDARHYEKDQQKATAWDAWLDCRTMQDVADLVGVPRKTADEWVGEKRKSADFAIAPASRQHFDIWNFTTADDSAGTGSYFGRMPPQVVENLLWLYTEPGQIVFDPFAGGGTTIEVAKAMGRRVWSSDRKPSTPTLPIHTHDITTGWPDDAPRKVDFVLLDPPYWAQAAGRYSSDDDDLGNMSLEDFMAAWSVVVKTCAEHLVDGGHLAFIISPTQRDDGTVVDHAFEMYRACDDEGLSIERRIIVPYNTQQATGQQVTWARENRRLLKLYRDLVVLRA